MQRVAHPQRLGDKLADPDERAVSFIVGFDGWPDDLLRFHDSVRTHTSVDYEIVVVDNPGDDDASERIAALDHVVHVPLRDRVGYGAGRNLGLRLATGAIACIVDTSVELTGDALSPVIAKLTDPDVGLIGRWGVTSDHGFHFEESDGPEVDAVEGYFMALRRSDLVRTGLFDPKFKFYRNADLDLSFRVRAQGMRAVVDPSLPMIRHEHRLWESTPEAQRDDLSRKNFFRFRDHWSDREDLFTRR